VRRDFPAGFLRKAPGRTRPERGKGREVIVPVFLEKMSSAKWDKVGNFFQSDDPTLPGALDTREVAVSLLFALGSGRHLSATFETWPPTTIDWHYESDQVLYIISGGPVRVTWEGHTLEGGPGDVLLFTRGTSLTIEIVHEAVTLAVYHPSFDETLRRSQEESGAE
jgi:ethanolamine utilization protein EutQ (cupin superfamily)